MFIRHPELNSRDAIPSHKKKCRVLKPYPELNSRDTFRATTQGTPASRPLRYHRSLVDHTHQNKQPHLLHDISWRNTLGARHIRPPDRLAGDAYRQAPSASGTTMPTGFAWRITPCR
ncbi:hypothetical protein DEO72_LG8g1613 [Vigna unguiculata]|uniref:Uncharacterized protein n=1 Tax=Vigna unguiculata TaxID=3917 RepID=A0A4D6MRA8_VIGUN|nr:hypothetical protein DEO72_LG8g1613 [Vigna unguiculata]